MRGWKQVFQQSRLSLQCQFEAWSAVSAQFRIPSRRASEESLSPRSCHVKARTFRAAAFSGGLRLERQLAPLLPGSQISLKLHSDSASGHARAWRDVTRHHAHGEVWEDPYSWMEAGTPDFIHYLREKRTVAEKTLCRLQPLQEQLLQYSLACLPAEQKPPPQRMGAFEYWAEQTEEAPSPMLMRRPCSGGRPQIMLDANEDPALEHVDCWGEMKVSPSGGRFAFTTPSLTGGTSLAVVREVATGCAPVWDLELVPDVVSLEWLGECHIVVTRADAFGRPYQALRRKVVGAKEPEEVLFTEDDPARFVTLGTTKDNAYVTINANSKTSCEVHVLDCSDPAGAPHVITPRRPGVQYYVEHCRGLSPPLTTDSRPIYSSGSSSSGGNSGSSTGSNTSSSTGGGGEMLVLTNGGSEDGELRLMSAAVGTPERNWRQLYKPPKGTSICDMDVFDCHCVFYERRFGRPAASVLVVAPPSGGDEAAVRQLSDEEGTIDHGALPAAANTDKGLSLGMPDGFMCEGTVATDGATTGGDNCGDNRGGVTRLQLPAWATSVAPSLNGHPGADTIQLVLSSAAEPEHHVDFRLDGDGVGQLAYVEALPEGCSHDPSDYVTRMEHATSADGTQVPLTIITPREADDAWAAYSRPHPTLLVVYGAYGEPLDASFDVSRLPLLARGWAIAFAHVRGGGECGQRWHTAATGVNKKLSVEDLEACLDALVASGISDPGRVAIEGTSAGALPAAALLLRRPGDLAAVLLRSPLVDFLATVTDADGPLVAHEASEWGNAIEDADCLRAVRQLCPYQTAVRMAEEAATSAQLQLPPVLVSVAADDDRTPPWGAAKFVAALEYLQSQRQVALAGRMPPAGRSDGSEAVAVEVRGEVLLLPRGGGGHIGDPKEHFTERAEEYAFLIEACSRI